MYKSIKVFLGGTCNNSTWRDRLIPMLKAPYFNPVVTDWTPECQQIEIEERKICNVCLYVITPKMQGVYSIAEAATDSLQKKTLFCVLFNDEGLSFDEAQSKSLHATMNLLSNNGADCFISLEDAANYLNAHVHW
jgi:hypothetical protein